MKNNWTTCKIISMKVNMQCSIQIVCYYYSFSFKSDDSLFWGLQSNNKRLFVITQKKKSKIAHSFFLFVLGYICWFTSYLTQLFITSDTRFLMCIFSFSTLLPICFFFSIGNVSISFAMGIVKVFSYNSMEFGTNDSYSFSGRILSCANSPVALQTPNQTPLNRRMNKSIILNRKRKKKKKHWKYVVPFILSVNSVFVYVFNR